MLKPLPTGIGHMATPDPRPGRWTRRVLLVGGPLDQQSRVLRIPDRLDWPRTWCVHPGAGEWAHYVNDPAKVGLYHYAGPCGPTNHEPPMPWEYGCCCGRPGCDGSGPYPDDEPDDTRSGEPAS